MVAAKKKKLKSLQKKEKLKQKEAESQQSASSWQQFAKKRGVASRESIFKSPDTVTGKVGVTGSGAEMTEFKVRMAWH